MRLYGRCNAPRKVSGQVVASCLSIKEGTSFIRTCMAGVRYNTKHAYICAREVNYIRSCAPSGWRYIADHACIQHILLCHSMRTAGSCNSAGPYPIRFSKTHHHHHSGYQRYSLSHGYPDEAFGVRDFMATSLTKHPPRDWTSGIGQPAPLFDK